MLVLLTTLALCLHLWALVWLLRPTEPVTAAQPLAMEVVLLSPQVQQHSAAPPQNLPSEPPKPKPKPKSKPKAKPQPKKPLPVAQQAPEIPRPAPVPAAETEARPVPESAAKPTASAAAAPAAPETFSEANYRANYASNPKPEYPRIARSRHWEGKVLLKVEVSAEGASESVAVFRSSGHDVLDESAVAAVEKWKFIPAQRGATPVASSVMVPIVFQLDYE